MKLKDFYQIILSCQKKAVPLYRKIKRSMNERKIYRLEIWAAIDNSRNWAYRPLSDFYPSTASIEQTHEELLKRYRELEQEYLYVDGVYNDNRIMEFNEAWYEYLSEIANEYIVDTHANMPEINEYILHE
jgi:hypothetical protein